MQSGQDFSEIELVINTTPPINTFAVLSALSESFPQADILSLYDPFKDMEAGRWYYEYWCATSKPQALSGELAALVDQVHGASVTAMHDWYATTAAKDPGYFEKIDRAIEQHQGPLGHYIELQFQNALACTGRERVDTLLDLSQNFPFFTIAREAASRLLVREDRHEEALAAFVPALKGYPFCHHTLHKLAELYVMADKTREARALLHRAQSLVPSSVVINRSLEEIEAKRTTRIFQRWSERGVRPVLKKRTVGLNCLTPVWGENYIKVFMDVTLASLLAPGNIESVARSHDVTYRLYTRRCDFKTITKHAHWKNLTDLISVELIAIEDVVEKAGKKDFHKYSLMSFLQSDGLQKSQQEGRHSFLVLGDFLLSSSLLENAVAKLDAGYETVFFQSFRTCEQEMLDDVVPRYTRGQGLALSALDLFREGRRHMHPGYRKHFEPHQVMRTPNSFYGLTDSACIIQHTMAQNAMFVPPCEDSTQIHATLDVDLGYEAADGGLGNYHFVENNLEMMFVELTQAHEEAQTHFPGHSDPQAYAYWGYRHMNPLNRLLGLSSTLFSETDTLPRFDTAQSDLAKKVSRIIL